MISEENLKRATRWLVYATFFVPLLVLPTNFIFPFIVPKILLFRSLVELMAAAYIILSLLDFRQYRPRLSALNLVVGLFFVGFAISTFVGVDSYHSFWDNHERMLGLFTIAHFYIYFLICGSIFRSWTDWKWALRIFLIAGAVVMAIGVLQVASPYLLLNQGSGRVASTLGNPIYVGGYGLFLTFVCYLLLVRENDLIWRWVYIAAGLLGILGLFFSGTRGSMLGLVAGVGALIIGYIFVLKNHGNIRKILIAVGVLIISLVGLLYQFRKTEFVSNLPAIGRTVNTSWTEVTTSPRWMAWEIAIKSWRERPIFGWGPNNYFYAFNKYYNPKLLNYGWGETWFDNAHNILVNTLAVQGIFGFITYLTIFVIGIVSLFVAQRRQLVHYQIAVVGSAFLVAHLVGNVTVFENPTSYLYFMFWLSMVDQLSSAGKDRLGRAQSVDDRATLNKSVADGCKIGVGLFAAVAGAAFLVVFIFNIQPAKANMATLDVIRTIAQDGQSALPQTRSVLEFYSPHIDDIRSDIARSVLQAFNSSGGKLGNQSGADLLTVVYGELQKNLLLHPLDIRNQITLAQFAQIGFSVSGDPKYIQDAERWLEDALARSLKRQQIIYSLAGIELQLNKKDVAIKLLEQAIDDNPSISESYLRLAAIFQYLGDRQRVNNTIKLARDSGVVFSEKDNSLIQQWLASSGSNRK